MFKRIPNILFVLFSASVLIAACGAKAAAPAPQKRTRLLLTLPILSQ